MKLYKQLTSSQSRWFHRFSIAFLHESRKRKLYVLLAFSLISSGVSSQETTNDALAIVAHSSVKVDGLTQNQVTRIFRAEQQFWENNTRITLLIRAPVSKERDLVLKRIYEMSENQFRKYWIGKMFKAEVASGPKIVYTTDMAINLINAIPGAISFIPYSQIDGDVKVLKVDGKHPKDPDYPWKI